MTTWTQIASLDAPTTGAFDFPSLDFTGYQLVQVVCAGITVTTDGTNLFLRYYVASAEVTTGYRWGMQSISTTPAVNDDGSTSAGGILLVSNDVNWNVGNAAGEGFGGIITIDNPTSTALYKKARFEVAFRGPSNLIAMNGGGILENTGAVMGLKITEAGAGITAGTVRVLGLA